jgi:hypothetical protein
MAKTNVSVNWEDQKEKLKKIFSGVTEKDLYFEKGKMDEMLVRLQNKVGKTRHELYKIIGKR